MLRAKKDMAANVLVQALLAIRADLPVRLAVHTGCVEYAVSRIAMQPRDSIGPRIGLTIEVGCGRPVCTLLSGVFAIDCSTARQSFRPALFCDEDAGRRKFYSQS
jgi:hypothetical protein